MFVLGLAALAGGFFMKQQGAALFWAPLAVGGGAMLLHWQLGRRK